MSRNRTRLYYFLRRSHRSVGVILSIFLVLLCVTGVLLNHTDDLGLDAQFVPSIFAAQYYPDSGNIKGMRFLDDDYYEFDGHLYVNNLEIARCPQLDSLVDIADQRVVLCAGELLILTLDNQFIERLDSSVGLPMNLSGLASVGAVLVLISKNRHYEFNLDTLELSNISASTKASLIKVEPVMVEIPREMILNKSVTWQQLILDVHSGIVVGNLGKWLLDLVALSLCGMAVSGIALWLKRR